MMFFFFFWYFVEFPANILTYSVMCITVLLLWQWYRIVWAVQTHYISPIICTYSNKCSESVFSNCFYILWSYVRARFKNKRLGDLMGIERDLILLGVHLLSFHKVSIVQETWLVVLSEISYTSTGVWKNSMQNIGKILKVTAAVLDSYKLQEFAFFLDEENFLWSGNVNSKNERHQCYENVLAVYEVPLYALKIGEWCWGACVLTKQF